MENLYLTVDSSAINTHPSKSVLFKGKYGRDYTKTHAMSNETLANSLSSLNKVQPIMIKVRELGTKD